MYARELIQSCYTALYLALQLLSATERRAVHRQDHATDSSAWLPGNTWTASSIGQKRALSLYNEMKSGIKNHFIPIFYIIKYIKFIKLKYYGPQNIPIARIRTYAYISIYIGRVFIQIIYTVYYAWLQGVVSII